MEFDFAPQDSVDKVPENFRSIFKPGDDGKVAVAPEFKGVAEALMGFDRSNKTLREQMKKLTPVDLSALAEFGTDPASIREGFKTKLTELETQLAKGEGAKVNIEKIKADLAAGHAIDLEKANKRGEALQQQLYGLMVENTATTAVAEAKGVPELLLPFIKNQVKVIEEDGKFNVYVVDPQGDRRYSTATGQPMTIKELVNEMKGNEKFGRLFESESQNGGGGKPPGSGRQVVKTPGRELSAAEKIAQGIANRQKRRA